MPIAPIDRQTLRLVVAVYVAERITTAKMIPMIAPVIRAFERTYGGRMSREVLETTVRELTFEVEREQRDDDRQQAVMLSGPGFAGFKKTPVEPEGLVEAVEPAPTVAPTRRTRARKAA